MKQAGIVLQVRCDSTRLPKKAMKRMGGIPLIRHCIRRLKQMVSPESIIVATTNLVADNCIEKICKEERVRVYRGSSDDVLDRYYHIREAYHYDVLVRATGDNPFVDPGEGKRLIAYALQHKVDYVSALKSALPVGVGLDAFSARAIVRMWNDTQQKAHREHINGYILDNPDAFKIHYMTCSKANKCPSLRLTVDTYDDYRFASRIVSSFEKSPWDIKTSEIITWWKLQQKMAHSLI